MNLKKNTGILIYFIFTTLLGFITVLMIPFALYKDEWFLYIIILILIFSIFLSGFMLKKYKDILRFYDIAYYIANEREEFARIIHDEIIQDLYSIINNLSLSKADIDLSREITRNLEKKSRNIMMQYRNSLLDEVDILDNFRSIVYDLENLFPNKHYSTEMDILLDENKLDNKDKLRILIIISKELLNNIYKHSNGYKIEFRIYIADDGYKIEIVSDGANEEDYHNILNSKSGILFIKFLVDSNGGSIDYFYEDGILKTKVFIKGDGIENNFT